MIAFHADGQYQSNTFQRRFKSNVDSDEYVLLPWDTSHWMDLAMESLRESSKSSEFLKRLISRSNRFNTLFRSGKGHEEYQGLAESLGLKSLEVVSFSTTHFFSSAFEQWEKIFISYPALIETYNRFRASDDDSEQITFQVILRKQIHLLDTDCLREKLI